MTVSTRLDSSVGVNSTNNSVGVTVARDASNKGFGPYPVDTSLTLTAAATLDASHSGLVLLSGSAGALVFVMPTAASVAGAKYIFRTTSADAHALTGSGETAGTKIFVDGQGTSATANGSKLTFPAVANSVVILESDGNKFVMTARSGTMTINGT